MQYLVQSLRLQEQVTLYTLNVFKGIEKLSWIFKKRMQETDRGNWFIELYKFFQLQIFKSIYIYLNYSIID